MEYRSRPPCDRGALGRVGACELRRQHPDRHRDILGLDVVADASGGSLARHQALHDAAEALPERCHPRVAKIGGDELDEGGRDDRLIDHSIEEVVDRPALWSGVLLEIDDVLFEDGDGERGPVGEVAVEAPLPDACALRDSAERGAEARFRVDLPRRRDQRTAVVGSGSRSAVGLLGRSGEGRHGCSIVPDTVVR